MTAFAPLLLLLLAAEVLSDGGVATTPDCGIKSSEDLFPWNAVLYRKKDKTILCGGTIISDRVVLTAAHCVFNENNKTINPAEDFLIAVGLTHANWSLRDPNEQRFEVQSIKAQPYFIGIASRYENDIAAIILNGRIMVTPHVMPACLQLNTPFTIKESDVGTMPAWNILLLDLERKFNGVKLNYDAFKNCQSRVQPESKPFIMVHDKVCATTESIASLRGNSGTGLTFPQSLVAGKTAHFLEGILSISDNASIIAFTNISAHGKWIEMVKKQVGDTHEISPIKTLSQQAQPL